MSLPVSTTVRTSFPREIRVIDHTWIPLSDGTRLSARIWLPTDAEQHPVPAILEYLPYRKDDGTALGDALQHPYFAGHGYAAVRVDLRGCGDSDGLLLGEYLKQEQDDALEVLAWLAEQTWCTGDVGMIGYSWGGFNGLQIAARQPVQLKAVITGASTDDRYLDDCHYMGGCMLASDMLKWSSSMLGYAIQPPDPRFVGEGWRELWLERLEHAPELARDWVSHQRRDAFWRHGSIAEDYSAVRCPVMAVGGWADAYVNAVPRMLENLERAAARPHRPVGPHAAALGRARAGDRIPPGGAALVGPLAQGHRQRHHARAHAARVDAGVRRPRGLLRRAARPLDRGLPSGRRSRRPAAPSRRFGAATLTVALGSSATTAGATRASALDGDRRSRCQAARSAARPPASGARTDSPMRSRSTSGPTTSARSPSPPPRYAEQLEVLGNPELSLRVSVDRPCAVVSARLEDVAPTGESLLVSWGLLNLTHRDSHAEPTPLEPGREYDVALQLRACGHRFASGHRIRLALSPTYWPHAWPSPEPVTLRRPRIGACSLAAARSRRPRTGRARVRRRRDRRPAAAGARRRRHSHAGGARRFRDRPPRHPRHPAQCLLAARLRAPRSSSRRTPTRSSRVTRSRQPCTACAKSAPQRPGRAWSIRIDAEMTCDAETFLDHRDVLGELRAGRSCSRRLGSTGFRAIWCSATAARLRHRLTEPVIDRTSVLIR